MEYYEKTYPANPTKCILVGTRAEFKVISALLKEYMELTRKNKSINTFIEKFDEASLHPVPSIILAQKEGRQLFEYIEKYAELKKKVKNHRVHKLLKEFNEALALW